MKKILIFATFIFPLALSLIVFPEVPHTVLAQTISIPWDEVRALYGDTIAQNARRMVEEEGTSPLLIRELDKWTGAIHFEYKLPSNIPTGNVNIWVYDPTTNTVTWSGPGPAPYSPEEALQKIQQYNSSGPQNPFTPQPSGTTQQISLLANNQKNIYVYVGDTINYTWQGPDGAGYTYSSTYTADAPDNCPGGIMQQGEIKPWVANTEQGSTSAQVQQCQAGRTYTITYTASNSSGTVVKDSVIVNVLTGQRPISQNLNQNTVNQYNPFDTSAYTGRTTIPGVTDRTQTTPQTTSQTQTPQNSLNSLTDSLNRVNSVLQSISNLDSNTQRSIIQLVQQFINSLRDLLTNLANQSNQQGGSVSGSTPTPNQTTQQISLLANGQTYLVASPGETITYTWRAPSGSGYTYSSTYIADAPDNCPGGIWQQGETKPWVANTAQGSETAQVQQCQAGRTYTITYTVKNSAGRIIDSTSITVRISNISSSTPPINQQISLLANGQTYLVVNPGETITYTWKAPSGSGYTYSSTYTSDAPDNCMGGITKLGEVKPWVANTEQGSNSAVVQQCQAGRTYTITYTVKNSAGANIAQTSIIIKVLNNQSQINNKDKIGVYFWGGNLQSSSNYLQDGINLAKRIGTKTIRIAISSKDMPLYKLSNQCSSDSLAQMAKNFENLFKDSQFDTIIITAYDQTGLSCSGKKYLDPSFYTSENIQKMKQEYKDLANYLGQNFPNKKFIIANWESDNDIYCGAAYGFNPSGNQCDYRNSIEAFKKFISVRTEAIKESNQPNVFSGVEFNIVNYLKDNNLPSTLYDVIPYVPADYYLYSAYESINNLYKDNGTNLLNSDILKIKQVLSNSGKNQNNLIIGEYGFGSGDSAQNKNLLSKATETFLNDGSIQYAIIWNLLNSGGPFGLFDGQENFTSQGDYIRQVLEENNQ
jgi:hypothetical protein